MTWMVYGANGYTGELIAELAVLRGEQPVLAGRSADKVVPLAERLGLPHRVFTLDDNAAIEAALADIDVVAHCAGPFTSTAAPMVGACLRGGVHYLDITGDIDIFERIARLDARAREAGVVLLPGAGFDVVPTDCLAAMVAAELPEATELELAFCGMAGASPGTAKSVVEGLSKGGRARIDGELKVVPAAWRTRTVDFPSRPRQVISIPWGDVSTAYRSTGIPTITAYTEVPIPVALVKAQGLLTPLLRIPAVRQLATGLAGRIKGPSERARAAARCEVWAQARDAQGRTVSRALLGPEGYNLTADAVLRAVARLLAGGVEPGSHTPSTAFGADFVRELDDVEVQDAVHAPG